MTTTTLPTHDLCEDHSPADFMDPFAGQIQEFRDSGTATKIVETQAQLFDGDRISVPTYVNEFWTARQRQASSLHGVSYRACSSPSCRASSSNVSRNPVTWCMIRSWGGEQLRWKPVLTQVRQSC
jgi:hypothetical protein